MSSLRSALVVALGFALLLIGFAAPASAQDDAYPEVVPAPAPAVVYGGPFSNTSGVLSGTEAGLLSADGALNLSDNAAAFQRPLAAAAAGTGGGAGGQLAFTGAQSSVLAAGGMALVLAGGAAVVVSRRRD